MSSPDTIARRLLRRHHLSGLRLSITERGVTAHAMPASYSPVIDRRRAAALEALSASGRTSLSVDEVTEITRKASSDPIATFVAPEIDLAIIGLEKELKRL